MYTIVCNAPWTENYATVTEQLFIGVTMTLLGVSIVLLILAVISLFISALSRLINRRPDRGVQPAGPVESASALPAAPIAASPDPDDAAGEQEALIAVITAAIAAFSADSPRQSTAGFVIRRVRRV